MTTDAQNPAVDALSEHLCAVMAAATLEAKPFYYLTTHDVFPADLYDEIQRCLPPTESYVPMAASRTKNASALQSRLRLNLTSQEMERVPRDYRPTWEVVSQAICAFPFVDQVFRKFAPGLSQRYREPLDIRVRVELFRDLKGYEVSPHTDAPHKVFTLIFYLPRDETQERLGTALYAPKDREFTDERGSQWPYELFDEKTRAPFLPNTLFAFMKSDHSFHGRPPHRGRCGT